MINPSKLNVHIRQAVVFDPANKEHRKLYHQFVKQSSWTGCPYNWIIDDDSTSILYMIQKKLVGYYTHKEFDKQKTSA